MKYSQIRHTIQDGDVALISGSSPISLLVRLFTAGSTSHVAVFFRDDDDVFVSEVREFTGHRITHASVWLEEQLAIGNHIKVGFAPSHVRNKPFVADFIHNHRTKIKRYAWWILPFVLLSRITGFGFRSSVFICSVYVQQAWQVNGRAWLPSDFDLKCERTTTITEI